MDILETLFDYQRFRKNAKLNARIDEVCERYLNSGAELPDEALELAAAGEPQPFRDGRKPNGAAGRSDG